MPIIIIAIIALIIGAWIFTSKKQRRVQRQQPLKTPEQILADFKPTNFAKVLVNFSYKGSQLQALFSDVLTMDGKAYLLGIENTTAIRIFTQKDIKDVQVSGKAQDIEAAIAELPKSEITVDLFSAEGKIATQPMRAKLESMQPALEALNSQGGYQQSPLEIYVERYE